MKSSSVLSAAVLFSSALAAVDKLGCYKSNAGVTFKATDDFNSEGKCGATLCPGSGVFAMQAKKCYCGDAKPVDSDKVATTNCNLSCPGYPDDNCGGKGFYFFYDSGILNSIPMTTASAESTSTTTSTSAAATSTKASVVTAPAQTVSVTASSKPTSGGDTGTKPNVAAIAAGVVVGILAIAAIMGGLFFFMRNRKRRAIEEEHRRNATNNLAKPPISSAGTSFNDTRLDPVMAHRRMSDGSIADNQDYSRRILKVTNA